MPPRRLLVVFELRLVTNGNKEGASLYPRAKQDVLKMY